jgi:hypothetical protein
MHYWHYWCFFQDVSVFGKSNSNNSPPSVRNTSNISIAIYGQPGGTSPAGGAAHIAVQGRIATGIGNGGIHQGDLNAIIQKQNPQGLHFAAITIPTEMSPPIIAPIFSLSPLAFLLRYVQLQNQATLQLTSISRLPHAHVFGRTRTSSVATISHE